MKCLQRCQCTCPEAELLDTFDAGPGSYTKEGSKLRQTERLVQLLDLDSGPERREPAQIGDGPDLAGGFGSVGFAQQANPIHILQPAVPTRVLDPSPPVKLAKHRSLQAPIAAQAVFPSVAQEYLAQVERAANDWRRTSHSKPIVVAHPILAPSPFFPQGGGFTQHRLTNAQAPPTKLVVASLAPEGYYRGHVLCRPVRPPTILSTPVCPASGGQQQQPVVSPRANGGRQVLYDTSLWTSPSRPIPSMKVGHPSSTAHEIQANCDRLFIKRATRLYFSYFPQLCSEKDYESYFQPYGPVFAINAWTVAGHTTGLGTVVMGKEEAELAMRALDGALRGAYKLRVKQYNPELSPGRLSIDSAFQQRASFRCPSLPRQLHLPPQQNASAVRDASTSTSPMKAAHAEASPGTFSTGSIKGTQTPHNEFQPGQPVFG